MLVNCRECNKQVSSDAKLCPYCGVNDPMPTTLKGMLMGLLFAIVVIGFVIIIAVKNT
jgi:tetrahydromethanopterin S-methyltransferase subunit F